MSHQSSSPSYHQQFLANRGIPVTSPETVDPENYESDYFAASQKDVNSDKEALTPPENLEKKPPKRNKELLWINNSRRFDEKAMPFLSSKSVKQVESNYRELMMVEANLTSLGKGKNTFYITSCVDKDGKTITAISAAYALSLYSGKEVLLIDFNQQDPQIHNLFGISDSPGFHEFCAGTARAEDVILPTLHKGLSVITIGETQGFANEEENIKKSLDELAANFDYVICDGSSVMSSSVALRHIRLFDAVMIVIECEKTRWEVLQIAEDKIKKSGGTSSIGIVCNRRKYYIPSIVYKVISKN